MKGSTSAAVRTAFLGRGICDSPLEHKRERRAPKCAKIFPEWSRRSLRAALASRGLRTQPGLDSSTFSFAPLFGNRALSPHGAPYPGCWGCTVCFLQDRRCPADRVPGLSDKAQAVFAQPPADALDRFQTPCAPHRVRMLYAATQVQPPLHMARCLSVKRTSLCGSPTESA